ncbi:MAG: DNA alkylation repair protein [Bacilli bacterium]|nr:DNA alkylation repair protein [Bacilli bacterium]
MEIKEAIFAGKDEENARLVRKLIPTVSPERVLGARIPYLRSLAKKIKGSEEAEQFLLSLPHEYFEEDILHAVLLSYIREFDRCAEYLEAFLPYVTNWSVCDTIKPFALTKNNPAFLKLISRWVKSDHPYAKRLGVKMLMDFFLGDAFEPTILEIPTLIHVEDYYVNMMIAWFYATALAKRWQETIPYIEKGILDSWVHNKTIQKAIESYRVSEEHKTYLKTMRR